MIVTVDEVKTHLRIQHSEEDDYLSGLIAQAQAAAEDYCRAQRLSGEVYRDRDKWAAMALTNTARSGVFASDRAIAEYADSIWHARPLHD